MKTVQGRWALGALSTLVIAALVVTGVTLISPSNEATLTASADDSVVEAGEHAGDESYAPPTLVGSSDPHVTTDPAKEAVSLTTLSTSVAQSLAAKYGLVILSSTGGNSIVAVPESRVTAVKADAPSANFEANQRYSVATDQTPVPSWGLDRIDTTAYALDSKYSYDSTGSGVRLYVVDTGINTSHVDFSGRIISGYSPLTDGYGYNDCQGHGTHVAGTAAGSSFGVAKGVRITPVRVLNCAGSGYVSDIVTGINWIMATHTGGPAVINLSIGGGYSATLNNAIATATSRGFTVVVAAGNNGSNACNFSPASTPSAITVGAVGLNDGWASFSNGGNCVDISAPGVNIISAYIGSSTATAGMSGTSMASPHVAGAAARLLQLSPGLSHSGVAATLASASAKNLITGISSGTVNNLLNLVAGGTSTPTTTVSPSPTSSATATSSPSPTSSTTTSPSPSPTTKRNLKAIKSFTVLSTTATTATVSWNTDPAESYDSFTVTASVWGSGRVAVTQTVSGGVRTATLLGLTKNTRYELRLSGSAQSGSTKLTTSALYGVIRTAVN